VTSVQIECWGADNNPSRLNTQLVNGGYAKGTKTVTAGQTLYIYVGGAGGVVGGGWNGGAIASHDPDPIPYVGGGASDVRLNGTNLTDRIIVAGGAGGASDWSGYGGVGGGTSGGNGYSIGGHQGFGGTQLAGGAKASGSYGLNDQEAGTLGLGGHSNASGASGGGGGGYYGGGGGSGSMQDDGGGGGGSSYITGLTDALTTAGVSAGNAGNGKVIITRN